MPAPDPASDQYRTQVQDRIQGLVSGKQPRDPHLAKASTGRLILEGVVENVKIYRLHKEEKLREAKEEKKRMKKGGRGRSAELEKHRRRHRDRSAERHGRHRSRDGERDERRERSRGRDGTRERRGEARPDDNPEHMMTGGAGPPGTLPEDDRDAEQRLGSRSRSRHRRTEGPRPGRAGASRSPTRSRFGPDGATPFGELPKKAAGVGLAAHLFNTYRHIKAEHDAGHRSRSAVEKALDSWRGKTPSAAQPRGPEKLQKKERGHDNSRSRGGGQSRDGHERQSNSRRSGNHDGRSDRGRNEDRGRGDRPRHADQPDRDKDLPRRPPTPYATREPSPERSSTEHDEPPSNPPRAPTPPPYVRYSELYGRTPPPPEIQVRDATPPEPSRSASPPWPPTPSNFVPRSRSASPPHPNRPRDDGRSTSPAMPMPQRVPVPPPPPPPPARPAPVPERGTLLDEIAGGAFNLKPVRKPDEETAAVYPETAHSHDVEDRERRQTWSDVGEEDDDNESERRRALKETLEAQIAGGQAGKIGRLSPAEDDRMSQTERLTEENRRRTVTSDGNKLRDEHGSGRAES